MNQFRSIILRLRGFLSSGHPSSQESRYQVLNLTRGTALATCMEVADSGPKRSKGLLGREALLAGQGLWIIPCEAVHTFWMRFPIDLVYLDSKKCIQKLVSDVPPWRLSACIWAHSVLELPAGTIRITQTQPGDKLDLSPVQPSSDSVGLSSTQT